MPSSERAFFSCMAASYIAPELTNLQATEDSEGILSPESAVRRGSTDTDRFWTWNGTDGACTNFPFSVPNPDALPRQRIRNFP